MNDVPLRNLFGIDEPWLTHWLTPIWVFSIGCAIALAILMLIWMVIQIVAVFYKPAGEFAKSVSSAVAEGVMLPIFIVLAAFSAFSLFGFLVAPDPTDLLAAISRTHKPVSTEEAFTIPAPPAGGKIKYEPIEIQFYGDEVDRISFFSNNENIRVSSTTTEDVEVEDGVQVFNRNIRADTNSVWLKATAMGNPFQGRYIEKLYVVNRGEGPTDLKIMVSSSPPNPEMNSVWYVAAGFVGLFLFYFAIRIFFPKISAVSIATAKSEIAQPAFIIALAVGAFMLFVFVFIPYNTFGEDIKMLKDTSMMMIMVLGIGLAVWASTKSIADEVEGKTALTVLSKPIGRREFILGKFLGILWMTALLFIVLGAVFLFTTAYKPVFDDREGGAADATWQLCHYQMMSIIPGLMLAFLETMVMAAISVAISTRLPMLANFTICFAIYALGHLTPLMVQSSAEGFEIVRFFSQFIATIVPVLDHFKIHAAIAADKPISLTYLGTATIYALINASIAMLVALISFEDRDLT